MFNFDYIAKESIKEHIPIWPENYYHSLWKGGYGWYGSVKNKCIS